MPPTRSHDPFNDAPRRPASRTQTHYDSRTSESDTDPTRRANLFASSLSRRPPPLAPLQNRLHPTSPVHEDDSADDSLAHIASTAPSFTRTTSGTSTTNLTSTTTRPTTRTRARRKAAPPSSSSNGLNIFSPTPEPLLNPEIVVRAKDGSYIPPIPEVGEQIHGTIADRAADETRFNASIAEFWSRSGGSGPLSLPSPGLREGRTRRRGMGEVGDELGIGRVSAREEEMWGKLRGEVLGRLREVVGERLGEERWLFERTDVMEALSVASHGRV
ncbi:hypothetical protein MBLNU457_1682t1 [Dothideomycetes sp. NU457]